MGHQGSWLDRAIDKLKPQLGAPQRPATPQVHQGEWNNSVERKEVVPGLTVHDVGLSVFGETRSLRDRSGSNEPIGVARQKVAHVIINGAELAHQTGKKPPTVHPPVQPSISALDNPEERAAYESSMNAAREAYLSGHDPTNGATHLNLDVTPTRANHVYSRGTPNGVPISTQSGPYRNSFPNKSVPSHIAWVNTYFPGGTRKRRTKNDDARAADDQSSFSTRIFLADSIQTACISPRLSGSRGQTSKSAKAGGGKVHMIPVAFL